MKYFNEQGSLVIKSWCDNLEEGAIEQARNLARLPFQLFRWLGGMTTKTETLKCDWPGCKETIQISFPGAALNDFYKCGGKYHACAEHKFKASQEFVEMLFEKQNPCCDDCNYESPEEKTTDKGDDWKWEYYCNLAGSRRIKREDNEPCPEWCPLLDVNNKP